MVRAVRTLVLFCNEQACPNFIIVAPFFSSFPLHGGVRLLIYLQGKLGTGNVRFTGTSCLCCQLTVVLSSTSFFSFFLCFRVETFFFFILQLEKFLAAYC